MPPPPSPEFAINAPLLAAITRYTTAALGFGPGAGIARLP